MTTVPTERRSAPSALWMHLAFILTGLGTLILGPILPILARQWHLQDAQSGLLFSAQFYGSFLGGVTVSKSLQRSMILGMAASAIGFGIFALSPNLLPACLGLFIGGYGLGQLITSINILAGRRATEHRGSALAFLNFSWSFGALLSPVLAAILTPHILLRTLLGIFAATFATLLVVLLIQLRGAATELIATETLNSSGLKASAFAYFCALLILYGGLETCLGGWLTTFSLRYGTSSLTLSEYTMVLLLAGLTAGRAASSLLLLRMGEKLLLRLSLALAAAFTAALALAHTAAAIAIFAVLLGLSLAPFFPATFSMLMADRPTARQAGIIVAVSAIGAAFLPWLMGVVSTRTGSLQYALALPFAAAAALFLLSLVQPPFPRPASV
ncbi:MFS transporter [Granulicella arctica]|uniref:MFS transporter n=1 Tax=Granulicella arctica TaxID=940613 RepID=UPI0021DF9255|nr:MFS transporter [Granulicella arctica]